MALIEKKKIYFASDFHLGMYPYDESKKREKIIIQWLDSIKNDAEEIYLVGDVFDYWYEYKKVVPKGFVRFLTKIIELTESGIKIHFLIGNHDIWIGNYLSGEIGFILHKEPVMIQSQNKTFYIAHGDGLGNGDFMFKLLKTIFHSKFLQWCFSKIHPDLTIAFAHRWAKHSRYSKGVIATFECEEKERLIGYSKKILETQHYDYFIYGHRHIPMTFQLNNQALYINLGDWITHYTYAVFDGKDVKLEKFSPSF
jgi:UDP-2,3-diacylglucosamine hydrolase